MSDTEGAVADDERELDLPSSSASDAESSEEEQEEVFDIEQLDPDAVPAAPEPVAKRAGRRAPVTRVTAASRAPVSCIVVTGADRRTSDMLTRSELAHVIASRARQIASGGASYAVGSFRTEKEIVAAELEQKRCPFIVRREIGRHEGKIVYEDWDVNELAIPPNS